MEECAWGFFVFFALVPELWLLLVTTDLDLSKPELSTLCSALCWGWELFVSWNHPAPAPFHRQWELIKEPSALLPLTDDGVG